MEKIEHNHTNNVFIDDDKIVIEKNDLIFNHKIDYSILSSFSFVPKLISASKELDVWKKIEGHTLTNPKDEDLIKIAKIMRELHKSEKKFPKNNLRRRVKEYVRVIHDKYLNIPEIDNNWKIMNTLITNMNNINPCHNDIWWQNIIKEDKTNEIFIIDWEYATMGDKHLDLAYYIESQMLDPRQEEIFLNAYDSQDKYQTFFPEWMDKYKMFVNWITLAWAYSQDQLPFPQEKIKKRINFLKNKV